ncbi:MAG: DUF1080 domain-containing protein [Maribacter sp.]|nr:DUF1080 domain-containing protein [Maribacter sp.]
MSITPKLTAILLLFLGFANFTTAQEKVGASWQVLFDGTSLDQWDTYLGAQFKPGVTSENLKEQPIPGVNNDFPGVFTMVKVEGEKVLRISGEFWGGISTKTEFENYHLRLQFKWGQKKWYPKEKETDRRDSGLLYHGVGEHGAGDGFWLRSQEFQIQEGDTGDYWGVAGAMCDIRASKIDSETYQYDKDGPLLSFGEQMEIGRHCKKYPDAEKPSGEWNTIDLYCFRGTSIHVVNGVVTMILENSRMLEDGKERPLHKGKIQLQSEAAEVYYKNIAIQPIDALPDF